MSSILPILALIALGWSARWRGWLKPGDDRVLSAYIYYFALPSLFFIDIARTNFTEQVAIFAAAAALPMFLLLIVYGLIRVIFRLSGDTFRLLALSSVFGSTAFFGLPFIIFAFGTPEAERLAVLAAAFISLVGAVFSIFLLESHRLEQEGQKDLRTAAATVVLRLMRNPLIISISAGLLFSLAGLTVPVSLIRPLEMLGRTTATVAIFMLGAVLYGKQYTALPQAAGLSLLRIMVLPILALITVRYLGLAKIEGTILVLMHSMPLAISMVTLSERYDFHRETIASLAMVSSLSAAVYLNLWLLILSRI